MAIIVYKNNIFSWYFQPQGTAAVACYERGAAPLFGGGSLDLGA